MSLITIFVILIMIIELSLSLYFVRAKITEYIEITSVVTGNNEVRVLVNNSERKALYNNSIFYIDDSKTKYSVKKDNGVLWQKDKTKYYELLINVKLKDKYKNNDIVTVSLAKKKINIIEAIMKTWGGE